MKKIWSERIIVGEYASAHVVANHMKGTFAVCHYEVTVVVEGLAWFDKHTGTLRIDANASYHVEHDWSGNLDGVAPYRLLDVVSSSPEHAIRRTIGALDSYVLVVEEAARLIYSVLHSDEELIADFIRRDLEEVEG